MPPPPPPRALRSAILLVALSGSAFFSAAGAVELLTARLGVRRAILPSAPGARAARERDRSAEADAILARNVFDHRLGGPEPGPEPGPLPPVADEETAACEAVRLVATWVRRDSPRRSLATLAAADGSHVVTVGAAIGGRVVSSIDERRVVLQADGDRPCAVRMFDPPPAVVCSLPSATPEPPRLGTGPAAGVGSVTAAELDADITPVGDGRWTIARSLVDRLLAEPTALLAVARVVPREEGGRVVGLRIFGASRGSLLARIGVRNGDTLRTLDGYDLSDPDQALQAYAHLRTARRLTLTIERDGAPMALGYELR